MLDGAADVISPQEITADFEIDYLEACKRAECTPFAIRKIKWPLPPLPIPNEEPCTNNSHDLNKDKNAPAGDPAANITTAIASNNATSSAIGPSSGASNSTTNAATTNPNTIATVATSAAASTIAESNLITSPSPPPIAAPEGAKATPKSANRRTSGVGNIQSSASTAFPSKKSNVAAGRPPAPNGTSNPPPPVASENTLPPQPPSATTVQASPSRPTSAEKTTEQSTKRLNGYRYTPNVDIIVGNEAGEDEIQAVEVRGWMLTKGIMEALSFAIPACNSIKKLTLWNCGLTDAQFNLLLPAVLGSTLRHLAVDDCPSLNESVWALLISEESPITSLSLRGDRIGDVGAKGLGIALRVNRSLRVLDLWRNRVGPDGLSEIADALKYNQSLMFLGMCDNNVCDIGAIAFAKVLSNAPVTPDELAARKKVLAELALRRDQEDDALGRKARNPYSAGSNRLGAEDAKHQSASQINLSVLAIAKKAGNKTVSKKDDKINISSVIVNAKGSPEKASATPTSGSVVRKITTPAPVAVPSSPGKGTGGGKGANAPSAAASAAAKGAKKGGKSEEKPIEEVDEPEEPPVPTSPDPQMVEVNGSMVFVGNRTLSYLNLRGNGLTNIGYTALAKAVIDQQDIVAVNPGLASGGEGLVQIVVE
ncbi:hypothetical protein SeMB42_g06944, partial [Synchytrium endobioticum]